MEHRNFRNPKRLYIDRFRITIIAWSEYLIIDIGAFRIGA